MKYWFIIALIACFTGSVFAQQSFILPDSVHQKTIGQIVAQTAQRPQQNTKSVIYICCGVKQPQPMFIIKIHQKSFLLDTVGFSNISPDAIKSIEVLKDAPSYQRYGNAAKYGVIIVTLKDEKYSDDFDEFKGHFKKIEL